LEVPAKGLEKGSWQAEEGLSAIIPVAEVARNDHKLMTGQIRVGAGEQD
jgi:hypothetical protein